MESTRNFLYATEIVYLITLSPILKNIFRKREEIKLQIIRHK